MATVARRNLPAEFLETETTQHEWQDSGDVSQLNSMFRVSQNIGPHVISIEYLHVKSCWLSLEGKLWRSWNSVDVGPKTASKIFRITSRKSELCCFHGTNDILGVLRWSLCECFGALRVESQRLVGVLSVFQ